MGNSLVTFNSLLDSQKLPVPAQASFLSVTQTLCCSNRKGRKKPSGYTPGVSLLCPTLFINARPWLIRCKYSGAGGTRQGQDAVLQGSGTMRSCHLTEEGKLWPLAASIPWVQQLLRGPAACRATLLLLAALFCRSGCSAFEVMLVPNALELPPVYPLCAEWREAANKMQLYHGRKWRTRPMTTLMILVSNVRSGMWLNNGIALLYWHKSESEK